ncbi:MAG: type I secretion system permease/ATPase [Beijerinckiaceae bacterium]
MEKPSSPLDIALFRLKKPLIGVVVFSSFVNLLLLVSPIYMLQVFERVLSSLNETTLVMLSLIAIIGIIVQALLERAKTVVLNRCGVQIDRDVAPHLFDAVHSAMIKAPGTIGVSALRDLDLLRDFFVSEAILTIIDAPWFPLFVIVLWIVHPWFAILAVVSAVFVMILTFASAHYASGPVKEAQAAARRSSDRAVAIFQNAEVVHAMGMRPGLREQWAHEQQQSLAWQANSNIISSGFTAAARFVRNATQMAGIGMAAYLVILREIGPGHIFAATVLLGISLKPIEGVIARWKTLVSTREAYRNLKQLFADLPDTRHHVSLPRPLGRLTLQNVSVGTPVAPPRVILHGISFDLPAGNALAIVGPSAAGKTSLLRTILGIWRPVYGEVRIDGAEIQQWSDADLGRYLGYLPQDVALFQGSVAQNIARFEPSPQFEAVGEAARLARIEEMVLLLPDGYNSQLGVGGSGLSGGQRQRLGLARAVYERPAIVILDEPNSNLDADGEAKLMATVRDLTRGGTTVLFVTHKTSLLAVADYILALGEGTVQHFGKREEVLVKLSRPKVVQLQAQNLR